MAENLANELNRLAREDCDFLGGDGPALLDLLDDYLGVPEEELSDDELPADNDQHYQEGTNHNNEYTELCVRACVCVCVPDWCFGLFKRAFKRTKVGCLDDLVKVCEGSAKVNKSQLVGTQDGTVVVPTYNWSAFFQPFFKANPFKGLKKLHNTCASQPHTLAFVFSKRHPMVKKE